MPAFAAVWFARSRSGVLAFLTGGLRTDIPARMVTRAFAAGCSAHELTDDERAFFRESRPCGLILFRRNCGDPDQVRRLAGEAAEAAGGQAFLVLVDQEGGRVRRLRPPAWRDYPSARAFAQLYLDDGETGLEAVRLAAQLVAADLRDAGITVNCAPVLDLSVPGAHDIIGDRAYGSDPETVIALGRAAAEGYMAGGVVPVIKHIPGHGRARADSHESLPVIDTPLQDLEASDFAPFAAMRDMPAAMTAHLLFTALDRERPVSVSARIIGEVIRGSIGFDGLLFSDDLSMKALDGTLGQRATGAIAAGCDIALHCNGNLREMQEIAEVVPELRGKGLKRFEEAVGVTREIEPLDTGRAEALLDRVAGAAIG